MYQEQERQDELGLNWDSFKWRNYDYAIGRFMNIDPLAEKYAYQSPYNFSENRVIDCRELEGLEAVKSTRVQNKITTIDVTVRIKVINHTTQASPMTSEDIDIAFNNFKSQAEKSFSGKNTANQQVNVKIIRDDNATLTLDYVDRIHNPLHDNDPPGDYSKIADSQAPEYVSEIGNTQTGSIQVSSYNTVWQPEGIVEPVGRGQVAAHGLGHIFGIRHPDQHPDGRTKVGHRLKNNLMNSSPVKGQRDITEAQRTEMLKFIPEEKEKKPKD